MPTPSAAFDQPLVESPLPALSLDETAGALRRWFGVDLGIVDAATGGVLRQSVDGPGAVGTACLRLAARAAAANQALVEARGPLAGVAIPLGESAPALVAVGLLPINGSPTEGDLRGAADFWGLDLAEARCRLAICPAMPAAALDRLARLSAALFQANARAERLDIEVAELSGNLSHTYEEISLVYRLSQNLRLTRQSSDLSQLAVESLLEIVDAEALIVQPVDCRDEAEDGAATPRPPQELIVAGRSPLDRYGLARLVEHFQLRPSSAPAVINRAAERRTAWPFPGVESAIVCPIGDGGHHCGWLAAINRGGGKEFGSVEADLLRSIAAILGMHGGNTELYRQQAELLSGIVRALTSAIDAKDPYTCGHSDRVARVSVRLAEELGCAPEVVETIYLAGLLHDVGKIGIDDNVLRKPGKLTDAEYEHIKTHARIGYNILVDLKQLGPVLPVVLHHHESWDGRGYPNGLEGETIPFLARIVSVADAFDAMGSDRPYRKGMEDERLDAIIRQGAGRQWDAEVVEAYFRAREDIRAIAKGNARPTEREAVAYS